MTTPYDDQPQYGQSWRDADDAIPKTSRPADERSDHETNPVCGCPMVIHHETDCRHPDNDWARRE